MATEMEKLSIVISTMFKDAGTRAASRAVKGLSDEIDSVGDRAERSASRARTAFASISKAMRETRAEAKTGASFKVSANASALAGIRRTFQGLRQDAARGATFEAKGDASGLRDVQGIFQSIRRDAANGAVFRTRLDQSGMAGVRESFSRIRTDASNGATFKVKSDQQGLSGIRGAFSSIRSDASNGAAFRVKGVLSGISGIPGVLASIRQDAANGATFRVHAEATGIPGVMGALGALDQRAQTMDQKWGHSVHIHTDATNVDGVMAELSRLGIEATRLDNNEIDIPVDADSENARRELEQIRLVAQSLSTQQARIKVDADAAAARVRLAEIERQVNSLNGQTAEVNVRTNGAAGIADLGNKIRGLGAVIAVANVPTLISMLAAVPAVASAAGAGIGALAVGIGSGLAGAAVAGAGAMGVLGASMALVGDPISALVGKLTDYHSGLQSSGAASQAASSAAQQYGDASRAVDQAVAKRGQTEQDVAQQVGDAWTSYQRQQEQTGQTAQQVAQQTADAWQSYQDSIADTGRTTHEVAQANSDAWNQYVATREKTSQVEEQVAQASADAASQLDDTRVALMASTAAVAREQREYNQALSDEPRNQAYSALDLADARDRLSDSTRQYNEDVAKYGANSEQATDSLRAMQRAELDLQKQQQATTEIQKNGSDELKGAFGELVSAQTERGQAAIAVQKAEENADRVAAQGAQQIAEARKAESDQYQAFLRTQQQGAQQIQDAKKAEAQAYEAYRRTEAQGVQQMAAARQAEADQYQAYQRAKAQGDRQLQESQDAVNQAVLAASRAAEAMGAAQEKAAGGAVVLTAAEQALYDRFMAFKADAASAFQPAMDSAALLGVRVLDLADSYLPALGAASYAAMGELGRAFDGFASKLRQPIPAGAIQTILDYVPEATYLAATAAGDLGIALVTALSIAAPYGMDLLRIVGGLLSTFEGWMTSTEGVAATDAAFAGLYDRAGQVWGIVSDLAAGLYGLGVALESSGLVGMAMGGLGAMAQNFRDATSSSSGLSGNMERLKPVLQGIVGIAGVVYDEFFRVADAVLAATNPDTGNSTLLELMDSLKAVVPVIGDTLIATFEELAPAISRNIGPISEFVGNFIGSTDTLVRIVDSLGGMAQRFNDLPAPVKDAAAELATMAGALSLIGVGPTSMLQTGAYAAILANNMYQMAPGIVTAVTALWGYASAAAAALVPFAGLAALGAIAIGVALTFDWGGAKDAWTRAREEGDGVGVAFGEALDAGLKTVPILGTVWGLFNSAVDWLDKQAPPESLLDKLTGAGKDDPSIVPNLQAMWDGALAWWAGIGPPGPSVLDVLMGNAGAEENPITKALSGWWAGANEFVAGLVPTGPSVLDVLMGNATAEENPITSKLSAWWVGANEYIAALVPTGPSVLDVLMGRAEEGENPITAKLALWWTGANEWLAALVPTGPTVLDVLMGRAEEGENPITAKLALWWTGANEWLAGLVPAGPTVLDVLMGRAEEGENPITAKLSAWWTGATGWLAGLVPEVSMLDVVMGRGKAEENPILATVMGWWTGLTAWLTPALAALGQLFLTGWTYVSTATTTALTGVLTFVQGWWVTLSALFTTGLALVGQVFLAGWTFVSTSTMAVLVGIGTFVMGWWTTLSGYFTTGLRLVGSVVMAGWTFVSTTTSSIFAGILSFLSGWWSSGKALFFSDLEAVKGAVGAGWGWVSSTTSSVYGAVASFLGGWWASTTSLFSSSVEAVKSGVGAGWGWVSSTTSSVFSAIGSFFGGWWSGTKDLFFSAVDAVKSGVGAGWDWLSEKTTSTYTGIRDTVVSLFTDAKDKALGIAGSLKDGAVRVFEGLRDATKGIFTTVGENIWKPVEFAEGKLKEVWNRIIDGVASVLEAIGDPGGLAGKLKGAKLAEGGVASGTQGVQAFAKGGLGTSNPNARIHMWNEQQGDEAFVAERGPKKRQLGILGTAASWFNQVLVPANQRGGDFGGRGRARRRIAEGGVRAFAAGGLSGEAIGAMKSRAESLLGKPYIYGPSGYYGGPDGGSCSGIWNYIVTGQAGEVGGGTYAYHAGKPGWERGPGQVEIGVDLGGWGGYDGTHMAGDIEGTTYESTISEGVHHGVGAGAFGTVWHIGDEKAAATPGNGGGGVGDWLRQKAEGLWDKTVGSLYKDLDFGPHVLAKGAANIVEQSGESIKKWVFDSLPLGGGGSGTGGFKGGGDAEANRALGQKMADGLKGWVGGQWTALDAIWQAESGWDNHADNPSSDAYGIPQGMMGPGGSVPPPGYMPPESDPAVQIAWGLDYIAGRYGDPISAKSFRDSAGYYKLGGVVPGGKNEPFPAILHGQERILSASTNEAFERLAKSITLWSQRGSGGGVEDPGGGVGSLETNARIVEELGEIRRVLKESGIKVRDLDRPAAEKVGAGLEGRIRRFAGSPEFGDAVQGHRARHERAVRVGGGH